MKKIQQIREKYDSLTGAEDNADRNLFALVKAGLLESNKLSLLKRVMSEETKVMTPSEHRALIETLDALITHFSNEAGMISEEKEKVSKSLAAPMMPSVLVLKRKAMRVYPGGQNVGLYYSQQLDKYVAVPFGETGDKAVLSMNEETQLDEIYDRLASNTFAKRTVATRESKNKKDVVKNLTKANNTAQRIVRKVAYDKGIPAAEKKAKDLLNHADKYHEALNATGQKQGGVKVKKQKLAKKQEPAKKEKVDSPLSSGKKKVTPLPSSTTTTPKPKKPRKPKNPEIANQDEIDNDKKLRGTSLGGDIVKHAGEKYAAGHIVGKMLYRKLKPKAPTPVMKQQVDEGLKTVIGGIVKKVKSGAKSAGRAVSNALSSGGANNSSSSSSTERESPFKKLRNDQQSRLRITTSGVDADRNRRVQRSMAVSETTEVNLDGNLFQLNTSVANKVLNVYQSLNEENRVKMVDKMREGEDSLNKVISFALRQ